MAPEGVGPFPPRSLDLDALIAVSQFERPGRAQRPRPVRPPRAGTDMATFPAVNTSGVGAGSTVNRRAWSPPIRRLSQVMTSTGVLRVSEVRPRIRPPLAPSATLQA
jgi:hypothetical protein